MWTVVLKRTKPCHGVDELPAIHNLAFVGYRYFDSSYALKAVLCSIRASLKKGPNRSIFASYKGIPVRYAEAAS